jgi:phosphoserine phosphatase
MTATPNIGGTSDWWESKRKALVDAFRKLPIKEPTTAGIPYAFFLGDFARELMLMRPVQSPAAKQPKEALRTLATLTERALEVLARISHTNKRIGLPNQRKLLCRNDFTQVRGAPDADRV